MLRILFTGGGGAGNEALFRLLGTKYFLHFADADVNAIDPAIPPENRHSLPLASDTNFVKKTVDLCFQLSIDVLVPGVDEELYPLVTRINEFGSTRLLVPSPDYVATMLDKLSMSEALLVKSLPVPRTNPLSNGWGDLVFPCIAKPRNGRGSRGVSVLWGSEDAKSLCASLGMLASEYIIQQKIEGQEYTVQMVADSHGELRAVVPVKVLNKRGITLKAETCGQVNVIKACQAIHAALPTSGCYNIQLMLTKDGQVMPFEINPRVSTTLCLVVAAGIDPIEIFTSQRAHPHTGLEGFITGLHLQRHWTNHFSKG